MHRGWTWLGAAASFLLVACQATSASGPSSSAAAPAAAAPAARELRVGDPAPDFTLPDQRRQNVTLSQFRGQPVQIAFYVFAFSGG